MNNSPDNRSDSPGDEAWAQRARALHEHACAHIDTRTRARLAVARSEALGGGRRSQRLVWLPAAGAMAACMLVIGVMWLRPQPPGAPPAHEETAQADSELPLATDAHQLDFYQNLDFYQWLAQQSQPPAHPRRGGR